LKARHDYLTGGKDPILRSLIDKVMDEFSVARDWWKDPEVIRIGNAVKELHDPACGWQHFDLSVLTLEGRRDLRFVVYGLQRGAESQRVNGRYLAGLGTAWPKFRT